MNTNKNSYTVIYTIVLVAIVATILALVSMGLKQKQQTNIEVEKQLSILSSANLAQDVKSAKDKNSYVQGEFAKYITEALVVNAKGEVLESCTEDITKSAAFKISIAEEYAKMRDIDAAKDEAAKESLINELRLPVFVCNMPDGGMRFILSAYGAGLWGPIWAYVAVKKEGTELSGAIFDHSSETPGLGGEIVTDKFRNQFVDKVIFDNGEICEIKVVKGGAKDPAHEVDALSGATITSTSVQKMLTQWFNYYKPYLQLIVDGSGNMPEAGIEVKEFEQDPEVIEL